MNRSLLIGYLLLLPHVAGSAMDPHVVASIMPLHSLVAGVMEGVAEPKLLVRGGASPHGYSLRPHDVRALHDAQLVFWAGESLETFLAKPLTNLDTARTVPLLKVPGLELLPIRSGGILTSRGQDTHLSKPGHNHGDDDPHVWLNPRNAIAMARTIGAALATVDSGNRAAYEENTARLIKRLSRLDRDLDTILAPVRGKPYVVFHDAYQYFEHRYDLANVGSLVLSPDHQVGARRLQELRNYVNAGQVKCVFSEPQFEPALVNVLLEGTSAQAAVLDPIGSDIAPGPDAYFVLLRRLGSSVRNCLQN